MQLIIRELGGWEFRLRKMGVSWQESGRNMAGKWEKQGLGLRQRSTTIKM